MDLPKPSGLGHSPSKALSSMAHLELIIFLSNSSLPHAAAPFSLPRPGRPLLPSSLPWGQYIKITECA